MADAIMEEGWEIYQYYVHILEEVEQHIADLIKSGIPIASGMLEEVRPETFDGIGLDFGGIRLNVWFEVGPDGAIRTQFDSIFYENDDE